MATISQELAIAIEHHQAGRLPAAEQIYRQILAIEPDHSDAIHLLGLLAFQTGNLEIAVDHLARAVHLAGANSSMHYDLANAFYAQGKLPEAAACFRRALELKPDFVEAHINLGNALHTQGNSAEAVICFHRALELKPDLAQSHLNLGVALQAQGKLPEATASFRRALELKPDFAEAHTNLGNALRSQGKADEATACLRQALALRPDWVEIHNYLGHYLEMQGKLPEAAACFRRALELKPDDALARRSLASIDLDYAQRRALFGGSLQRFDHIRNFDAYLDIPGWFDFEDIYDLAVAEGRPGGVFVEVGCWQGRSIAYLGSRLAMAQKQVSIYAVDPWLCWVDDRPASLFGTFLKNMEATGLVDLVTPLRMTSTRAARLFDDRSVDFCFIDGDHRYQAVREDLRCWFPKIRPGGLIAGHDYAGPDSAGVKQAVDEFFPSPVQASGKSWLARKAP